MRGPRFVEKNAKSLKRKRVPKVGQRSPFVGTTGIALLGPVHLKQEEGLFGGTQARTGALVAKASRKELNARGKRKITAAMRPTKLCGGKTGEICESRGTRGRGMPVRVERKTSTAPRQRSLQGDKVHKNDAPAELSATGTPGREHFRTNAAGKRGLGPKEGERKRKNKITAELLGSKDILSWKGGFLGNKSDMGFDDGKGEGGKATVEGCRSE